MRFLLKKREQIYNIKKVNWVHDINGGDYKQEIDPNFHKKPLFMLILGHFEC